MPRPRFWSLEGFTVGALLAGAVFFIGDRVWPADSNSGQTGRPSSASEAPTQTDSPPTTSTPAATHADPPPQDATPPDPTPPASASADAIIDPGVCPQGVSYLGLDLPAVDESYTGKPLGQASSPVFSKSGGPVNEVFVVDGRCELELLFRMQGGERRTAQLSSGQWVIVAGGGMDPPGYFPADPGSVDVSLG